jgi:hypothetical protein
MEFLWRVEDLEATMDEYIYKTTIKNGKGYLATKKTRTSQHILRVVVGEIRWMAPSSAATNMAHFFKVENQVNIVHMIKTLVGPQ